MATSVYLDLDLASVPYVAGVPRFVYRELLEQTGRWLGRAGRHDGLALLVEEVRLIEYFGFFAESWRQRHVPPRDAAPGPMTISPVLDR